MSPDPRTVDDAAEAITLATGRAPTLEAVASAAGVSRSTVSRVVNGSPLVRADVASTVREAIERMGYVPNRAARSLANSQTMAIALVVPEDTIRFFGDPFFAATVQGIARGLEDSDYVLTLQFASPSAPSAKTMRYLLGGNVDGAIVVSHHSGDAFFTTLHERMPVVFGGRPFDPENHPSIFVDVDNAAGGALATQHLVDLGRRRIGTITGPADMQASLERLEGWRTALAGAGITDDLVAQGDFTRASGAAAMRDLLERAPGLDAVFAASDLMATGAIAVLRERGKRVPEDVAVVGFDDSPAATSEEIPITTVHQPSLEMGERMAHVMLGLLRGDDVERHSILPTHLVRRESA